MYTDNGFWDTFRSQFPLTNILHPTMQGRYMNALLAAQEQCGWLPSWSSPGETGGMLGNHSISLLADAWAKGIRDFDPEKALKAYAHEAMNKGPWGGANGRGFWKEYFQLGYVPYPESMGSSAQTMEYAYDDFCGYQLAKMVGNITKKYLPVRCTTIKMSLISLSDLCVERVLMVNGRNHSIHWNGGGLSVKEMHGIIHGQCSMMYKA